MKSKGPTNLRNLEGDVREALAGESPGQTIDCLDLPQMLDAIEAVDAGDEPDVLTHIAKCAYCRKQYLTLRGTFLEADALRQARETRDRPAHAWRNALEIFGGWLSAPFQVPRLRLGMAGATVLAAAVLGYVIGAGSIDKSPRVPSVPTVATVPGAPVASLPAPDLRAKMDRLKADLNRAWAENRRLKALAAKPPVMARPRLLPQPVPPPAVRVPVAVTVLAPVVRTVAGLGRPLLRIAAPSELIGRGDGATAVLSPAATWVLSDRPIFRCRFPGAGPDTRYLLRLYAGPGGTLTAEKVGPALEWQPDFRLPRGGKLTWTVSAKAGDSDYSATGRIGILTEDEAMRVQQTAARVEGLKRASVYLRAGLLTEATAVLEKVVSSSREYPAARRELVKLREAMLPQAKWAKAESPKEESPQDSPQHGT